MDFTLPVSIPDLAEPRLWYRNNVCVADHGVRHLAKHLLSFSHLILTTTLRGNGTGPSFPDQEREEKGLRQSHMEGAGVCIRHSEPSVPGLTIVIPQRPVPAPQSSAMVMAPPFFLVPFPPLLSSIPHFWPCLTSSPCPFQLCPVDFLSKMLDPLPRLRRYILLTLSQWSPPFLISSLSQQLLFSFSHTKMEMFSF